MHIPTLKSKATNVIPPLGGLGMTVTQHLAWDPVVRMFCRPGWQAEPGRSLSSLGGCWAQAHPPWRHRAGMVPPSQGVEVTRVGVPYHKVIITHVPYSLSDENTHFFCLWFHQHFDYMIVTSNMSALKMKWMAEACSASYQCIFWPLTISWTARALFFLCRWQKASTWPRDAVGPPRRKSSAEKRDSGHKARHSGARSPPTHDPNVLREV